MRLPGGIYTVSADYQGHSGTASFTFRDTQYEVEIGKNASPNMDILVTQPLEAEHES